MSPHSVEFGTLIHAAEELAPFQASALRLAALLGSQEQDPEQVLRAARLDLALTGRILGAANAASPGGAEPISSLEQATALLGKPATIELIRQSLPAEPQDPKTNGDPVRSSVLDEESPKELKLWKHSIICALATEGIDQFGRSELQPEAFVTALLHDLGNLLLERQPQSEEIRTLSHTQLGARVARHWGLPQRICSGIEFHHTPLSASDGPTRRLCSQVLLADAVAAEVGEGCVSGDPVKFSPALAGSMGLSRKGFLSLCEHTNVRYLNLLDSYVA